MINLNSYCINSRFSKGASNIIGNYLYETKIINEPEMSADHLMYEKDAMLANWDVEKAEMKVDDSAA